MKRIMSGGVAVQAPSPGPRASGLASIEEATRFLSISRSALYALMDKGELRYAKIGKSRRIPWAALEELVQRSTVAAG